MKNLDNLVKTGHLKKESFNQSEFDGLLRSGCIRLNDAQNNKLSLDSRFDLAYNAAHSVALAALRWHGYRSSNRYIVFQVLPDTLKLGPEVWRILAKSHDSRNLAEYEGFIEVEERLVNDLITATLQVVDAIKSLVKSA